MGPVGIPVYGIRDKWSGTILHLVVVPNARKAVIIGHLYLDFIEKYGGMYVYYIYHCEHHRVTVIFSIFFTGHSGQRK